MVPYLSDKAARCDKEEERDHIWNKKEISLFLIYFS